MARLIFFLLLILVLYYLLHYLIRDMPSFKKKMKGKPEPEELVLDPFCQTYIPKQSALKKRVGGQMLYFCSDKCLKSYLRGETKSSD
jgi:YHS domain-containing protein